MKQESIRGMVRKAEAMRKKIMPNGMNFFWIFPLLLLGGGIPVALRLTGVLQGRAADAVPMLGMLGAFVGSMCIVVSSMGSTAKYWNRYKEYYRTLFYPCVVLQGISVQRYTSAQGLDEAQANALYLLPDTAFAKYESDMGYEAVCDDIPYTAARISLRKPGSGSVTHRNELSASSETLVGGMLFRFAMQGADCFVRTRPIACGNCTQYFFTVRGGAAGTHADTLAPVDTDDTTFVSLFEAYTADGAIPQILSEQACRNAVLALAQRTGRQVLLCVQDGALYVLCNEQGLEEPGFSLTVPITPTSVGEQQEIIHEICALAKAMGAGT